MIQGQSLSPGSEGPATLKVLVESQAAADVDHGTELRGDPCEDLEARCCLCRRPIAPPLRVAVLAKERS